MGAAIAAHLANAGMRVLLLDIVPKDLTDAERLQPVARNRFAQGGLDKALKSRPAAFFHSASAALVSVGNLDDDLGKLAECDIVIEAVPEVIAIKQDLFARVEAVVKPGTVVTSNTSGLPLQDMLAGRGEDFRKHFIVTHFFNPVRYMKLLELVAAPETLPEVYDRVCVWGEDLLGKGIVVGKDTPNFVGNRIGAFAMMLAIHKMLEMKLQPEEVDAIAGPPMGRPKSAAFRTADMVGLDTFVHVADNCHRLLTDDPDRDVFLVPDFLRAMVQRKLLGNKTKGGFYKKTPTNEVLTIDPYTGEYRAKLDKTDATKFCKSLKDVDDVRERLRKLHADTGPAGQFAWKCRRPRLLTQRVLSAKSATT